MRLRRRPGAVCRTWTSDRRLSDVTRGPRWRRCGPFRSGETFRVFSGFCGMNDRSCDASTGFDEPVRRHLTPALDIVRHIVGLTGRQHGIVRRAEPGLGTAGPDMANRLEHAPVVERAGLDRHDVGIIPADMEQTNAALRTDRTADRNGRLSGCRCQSPATRPRAGPSRSRDPCAAPASTCRRPRTSAPDIPCSGSSTTSAAADGPRSGRFHTGTRPRAETGHGPHAWAILPDLKLPVIIAGLTAGAGRHDVGLSNSVVSVVRFVHHRYNKLVRCNETPDTKHRTCAFQRASGIENTESGTPNQEHLLGRHRRD